MDDKTRIRMILRVVSELGSVTLESLMIWLAPRIAAIDTARAFQTARERSWIEEEDRDRFEGSDPCCTITRLGAKELARAPVRSAKGLRTAGDDTHGDVPIESVLQALADFEQSGGASVQLVGWELDVAQSRIVVAWSQAIESGLIERCGSDVVDGIQEEMWMLTDSGHRACEETDAQTG